MGVLTTYFLRLERKVLGGTWRRQPPTSAAAALMWQRLAHSPPAALTSPLIGPEVAQQVTAANGRVRVSRPSVADDSRVAAGVGGGGGSSLWQPVHCWHSALLLHQPAAAHTRTEQSPQSHISHCYRRRIMDLQAVIVFVGGFAFCAVVGYIVSVFGAKEQASLFVVGRDQYLSIL